MTGVQEGDLKKRFRFYNELALGIRIRNDTIIIQKGNVVMSTTTFLPRRGPGRRTDPIEVETAKRRLEQYLQEQIDELFECPEPAPPSKQKAPAPSWWRNLLPSAR
jgi:hypothetical protein